LNSHGASRTRRYHSGTAHERGVILARAASNVG